MVTVGKVRDAHGLKGELFVVLFAGQADWAEGLESITLIRKEREKDYETGKELTVEKRHDYPIKRLKVHKNGMILKVDGISNRTEAEGFGGALVQISNEALISKPGEHVYLKELENFDVQDEKLGYLGKISGFSSNGPQDLIVVKIEGDKQAEIPLIPEFIAKLDFKAKRIDMVLPEGLLTSQQ